MDNTMNIDTKRHKLLGILVKRRFEVELKKVENDIIGISFDKVFQSLNCDEEQLKLITTDLYTSNEIEYHNAHGVIGLSATKRGGVAFANKKYLNRVYERRKEVVKFIVQTVIPILALVIAMLSLMLKFEGLKIQSDKDLQELKTVIKQQESRINKLEEIPKK